MRYVTQGKELILNEKGKDKEKGIGTIVIENTKPVCRNGIEINFHTVDVSIDVGNKGPIYQLQIKPLKESIGGKTVEKLKAYLIDQQNLSI